MSKPRNSWSFVVRWPADTKLDEPVRMLARPGERVDVLPRIAVRR